MKVSSGVNESLTAIVSLLTNESKLVSVSSNPNKSSTRIVSKQENEAIRPKSQIDGTSQIFG